MPTLNRRPERGKPNKYPGCRSRGAFTIGHPQASIAATELGEYERLVRPARACLICLHNDDSGQWWITWKPN
jgi:hypothetical protein